MPTRMPFIDARVAAIAVMAAALVGCSPATAPTPVTAQPGTTIQPTTAVPSPSVADPSPTAAGLDAPPDATLAAEGGDPVTGQLGTYVWLQTGSDAPWLPGAPIAVGSGEPLTMAFIPPGDITTWRARYVPSNAGDPTGALSLGEGSGEPGFSAPGPGSWTVEVAVEFAAGAGSASYFWRLEVE